MIVLRPNIGPLPTETRLGMYLTKFDLPLNVDGALVGYTGYDGPSGSPRALDVVCEGWGL